METLRAQPGDRQGGFAMVIILMLVMVLTVMGSIAVYRVKGEVRHTGRDTNHARAQLVAESAINWSLGALAVDRPEVLPFTAATHASNGADPLPDYLENGASNPRKLHSWDVTKLYGTNVQIDTAGWIYEESVDPGTSITGADDEIIAFKIWFPSDSTIRVSGKGTVDGVTSQVEMTGNLKYNPVDMR